MAAATEPSLAPWLRSLRDRAQTWVKASPLPGLLPPTDAYTDLIFAYGLARLDQPDMAQELRACAANVLGSMGEVHAFLLEAYSYRIGQALEAKPLARPLAQSVLDRFKGMCDHEISIIDRLRRHSRIIEPDQRIDPYRMYLARSRERERQLAELDDMTDAVELASRVRKLLQSLPKERDIGTQRQMLMAALDAAPRVGEDLAREVLDVVLSAYEAAPKVTSPHLLDEADNVLERAFFVAGAFNLVQFGGPLAGRFDHLLHKDHEGVALFGLEGLARQSFRTLRKLGMRDEINRLVNRLANTLLRGHEVPDIDLHTMPALLVVAAEWYFLGRDAEAEKVLLAARAMLPRNDPLKHLQQTKLACAYASTVGQAPVALAQKLFEELFEELKGVRDLFSSATHFSVSQLQFIESVVLAVVGDAITPGLQGRLRGDEPHII
jgi:hypothetical protein